MFLDETLATRGQYFLVSAVVLQSEQLPDIRNRVLDLELRSKRTHRWARTSVVRREAYLFGLADSLAAIERAFWKSYGAGVNYVDWVAETVALAAERLAPYDALTVVLDGGNWSEQERVKAALRSRNLHWRKVSGAKDEAEPLLRLADSLAGFLRDCEDGTLKRRPALERYLISL